MKNRKYTIEEINILKHNPNVVSVKYGKQIEYNDSFKKWAVIQKINHPELSAIQIFEMAGFDRNIINYKSAGDRVREWKEKYLSHKTIITNINSINELKKDSLEKQNNQILLLLLTRFDNLISIMARRNEK